MLEDDVAREAVPVARRRSGQFARGVSGNPAGRRKAGTEAPEKKAPREAALRAQKPEVEGKPDSAPPVTRNSSGRFQPGASGNPKGRQPRDFALVETCREAAPAVIARLCEIVVDKRSRPSDVISASRELLDRGFGRSQQQIDLNAKIDFGQQFEDFIRSLGHPSDAPKAMLVVEAVAVDVEEPPAPEAEALMAEALTVEAPEIETPEVARVVLPPLDPTEIRADDSTFERFEAALRGFA